MSTLITGNTYPVRDQLRALGGQWDAAAKGWRLVGTIAAVAGCAYDKIDGLCPDSSRPAECWFLQIQPGHTPDTSSAVRLTVGWIDEWSAKRAAATVPA